MPAVTLENKITVNLPSGYRLIRKDDVNKPFYSEDKKMSDIIKVVENIARQLNIRSINIEAVSNLVDYYKSLGYTPTGRKYYDSSWDDIVYMKKKLE